MAEKEKIHLTLSKETADWLRQEYPEADKLPEAVRSAIGDSRRFWSLLRVELEDSED